MERSLLVGNWKMALGAQASRALAERILPRCRGLKRTTVWFAPSFLSIPGVADLCRDSDVAVGAQNVHWESKGAFTGEVSVPDLKEAGCAFAIVGHSERRHIIGESFDLCAKRALGALAQGLKVIFCIGETLPEREAGKTTQVLADQLQPFLQKLPPEQLALVTIAYEPVWAIGTGRSATTAEIEDTHAVVEAYCNEHLKGASLPILYGGSVTPDNFSSILRCKLVAGGLVGGASLSPEKFIQMIELSEAK